MHNTNSISRTKFLSSPHDVLNKHMLILIVVIVILSFKAGVSASDLRQPDGKIPVEKTFTERDPVILQTANVPFPDRLADFRITPPEPLQMFVKQLDGGVSLWQIRFKEDPRLKGVKVLTLGTQNITLRKEDDEFANGSIFSAKVLLNVGQLEAQYERLLLRLEEKEKLLTISLFDGRQKTKTTLKVSDIRKLLRGPRGLQIIPELNSFLVPVEVKKTLIITDPKVVEDPTRTTNRERISPDGSTCRVHGNPNGAWTFQHIMARLANASGADAADFTLHWLLNWSATGNINGFPVYERNVVNLINSWPKIGIAPNQKLDLSQAPFKLLAIVNRIDLGTNVAYGTGNAGELRFIFGLMNVCDLPADFTVIVEYAVPRHTCQDVKDWANEWLALQNCEIDPADPSKCNYNDKLEQLTNEVVEAGLLNQIRTNDNAFFPPSTDPPVPIDQQGRQWELREFKLQNGFLQGSAVRNTPDSKMYNYLGNDPSGSLEKINSRTYLGHFADDLSSWINANAFIIKADRHDVPLIHPGTGKPFRGGSAINGNVADFYWDRDVPISSGSAPVYIADPYARFRFSFNTCNGCHSRETNTFQLHIKPAMYGDEAQLSAFLHGPLTVNDPVAKDSAGNPVLNSFDEPKQRSDALRAFAAPIGGCPLRRIQAGVFEREILQVPPITQLFHRPVLRTH